MKIIQSKADLFILDTKAFPEQLHLFASELLQSIESEVDPEHREDHLLRNPVILCDLGDQITQLLEGSPYGYEYVERIDLKGIGVFRVGVLLDNDWFIQYLIPRDGLDTETMQWLDEQAESRGADR